MTFEGRTRRPTAALLGRSQFLLGREVVEGQAACRAHAVGRQLDLAAWLPPEHEARAAPTGRIVRNPQEVERLRLAETLGTTIRNCASTELDEPHLVGVKGELEAREPCL